MSGIPFTRIQGVLHGNAEKGIATHSPLHAGRIAPVRRRLAPNPLLMRHTDGPKRPVTVLRAPGDEHKKIPAKSPVDVVNYIPCKTLQILSRPRLARGSICPTSGAVQIRDVRGAIRPHCQRSDRVHGCVRPHHGCSDYIRGAIRPHHGCSDCICGAIRPDHGCRDRIRGAIRSNHRRSDCVCGCNVQRFFRAIAAC